MDENPLSVEDHSTTRRDSGAVDAFGHIRMRISFKSSSGRRMLANFDEMISRCSNDSSKIHIAESIKCYESGAYRASIVTTYIAVCFDLIEKLRTLAAMGDKEAIEEIKKLENRQDQLEKDQPEALRKLLDFERGLLEVFRDKFGFFGKSEFEEMCRIRADRHRCAHPTYSNNSLPFTPPAELARLHIVNALNLVLTQPPRHGKAALDAISAVILSKYFPQAIEESVSRLRGTELHNARPVLLKAVIDALMFGWPDAASPFHHKIAAVRSVIAIVEMDRREATPRVTANTVKLLRRTESDCIRLAAAIIVRIKDVADNIPQQDYPTLKSLLQDKDMPERASFINRALDIPYLANEADAEVDKLTVANFVKFNGEPTPRLLNRMITVFCDAETKSEMSKNANLFMLKNAEYLGEKDLEGMISQIEGKNPQLLASQGFKKLISAISKSGKIPKKEILAVAKRLGLKSPLDESDDVVGVS